MKYDRVRYEGHKHISAEGQRLGLSDTTINIRIRTLKAIFNQLERDELIEVNPVSKVKLLRQDVDLTNCLTDEEIKAILAQPSTLSGEANKNRKPRMVPFSAAVAKLLLQLIDRRWLRRRAWRM